MEKVKQNFLIVVLALANIRFKIFLLKTENNGLENFFTHSLRLDLFITLVIMHINNFSSDEGDTKSAK